MAIPSLLASMANWFTPTILFCVLNLTIATIFIASNFKSPAPNHHHHQDRSETTTELYNSASQLSSSPSLLQRVRSIDFSFSSFQNSFPTESEVRRDSVSEVAPTPSLFDRVKSFKLSSGFKTDQVSGETPVRKDQDERDSDIDSHHDSTKDDDIITDGSKTSGESPAERLPMSNVVRSDRGKKVAATDGGGNEEGDRKMKGVVHDGHDASVDAKADDFIKRFKQQLKLQRLDSLRRLREMMNRGT